ncbi:MAG TPA: Uma2 family endonuclease [Gemmatimonadales bacterium]|nr:Uma2 family endonuclease [Gemmatimonadales bacterium]
MPQAAQRWTADMVRALPADGNRYEVIAGELFVTTAPSFDHQQAVLRLLLRIAPYVDAHGLGYALMSPADIEFDQETLVQPDVLVAPRIEGRRPRRWSDIKELSLAVEVLSPSTARADRTVKRRLFQRVGVPEYWIVDVEARLIERWRPGDERPEVLTEMLEWRPDPTARSLEIDLPRLFADIVDEPTQKDGKNVYEVVDVEEGEGDAGSEGP